MQKNRNGKGSKAGEPTGRERERETMGEMTDDVSRALGNAALRRKKERKKERKRMAEGGGGEEDQEEWKKSEKNGGRRQEIGVLTDRSMDPLFLLKQGSMEAEAKAEFNGSRSRRRRKGNGDGALQDRDEAHGEGGYYPQAAAVAAARGPAGEGA